MVAAIDVLAIMNTTWQREKAAGAGADSRPSSYLVPQWTISATSS
jgi:hypothetical protein